MSSVIRLGLMGGTFDPIHNAHLFAAQAAKSEFGLDRVLFVPSGTPPHKGGHVITPAEDRYAMALLATSSNPGFAVSRMEIERTGPSFTIDTLKSLNSSLSEGSEIFFITGTDAIIDIFTWKDWQSLFKLCHFVVVARPGYDFNEFIELISRYGEKVSGSILAKIHLLEIPLLEISSTDIRRRVLEGKPITYLVPVSVEEYIVKANLYKSHNPLGTTHTSIS